ncbi:unnamed protein product, partial [Mesorhabditis belari]|uniref:Uncharacterized protein n=1 Tax=Mesorhabditis belari TaxID=2138241 RepID=A0AAF3FPU2_9BILA
MVLSCLPCCSKGDETEDRENLIENEPNDDLKPKKRASLREFYHFASWLDIFLTIFGICLSLCSGMGYPLMSTVLGRISQAMINYDFIRKNETIGPEDLQEAKEILNVKISACCWDFAYIAGAWMILSFFQCNFSDGDVTKSAAAIDSFEDLVKRGTEGIGVDLMMTDGGFCVARRKNIQEISRNESTCANCSSRCASYPDDISKLSEHLNPITAEFIHDEVNNAYFKFNNFEFERFDDNFIADSWKNDKFRQKSVTYTLRLPYKNVRRIDLEAIDYVKHDRDNYIQILKQAAKDDQDDLFKLRDI